MNIFIAGAASSMSAPLLRQLEEDKEVKSVVGIDIRPPKGHFSKLRFLQADIRDDLVGTMMKGCDTLVNFAFVIRDLKDEKKMYDINIKGTHNLYESAARVGVKKIIHVSSVAAYGSHSDHELPLTEESPVRGNSREGFFYSWAKMKLEKYLDGFREQYPGIVVTRIRPGFVLGEQANDDLDMLLRSPVLPAFIGKNHKLPIVHEDDLSQAFYLAVKGKFHDAFNIVGDNELSMTDIAKIVGKPALPMSFSLLRLLTEAAYTFNLSPVNSRALKVFEHPHQVSSEKAKTVLGWQPRYTSRQAVESLAKRRGEPPLDTSAAWPRSLGAGS